MTEIEQRLRYAAKILDSLTGAERAAWDEQLDALVRRDYRAAQTSMAKIRAMAEEAYRAGRWTDVDHLALLKLAFDVDVDARNIRSALRACSPHEIATAGAAEFDAMCKSMLGIEPGGDPQGRLRGGTSGG
jgi:hypothetical protein